MKVSEHDAIAECIARKFGTQYNRGAGPDIVTPNMAIEVETYYTIPEAEKQLSGYSCPVYVVGTNESATMRALGYYGTYDIGVMDSIGNIRRHSTRR